MTDFGASRVIALSAITGEQARGYEAPALRGSVRAPLKRARVARRDAVRSD